MQPLSPEHLRELRAERNRLGDGRGLSKEDLDWLTERWAKRVHPDPKDISESFAIARRDGSTTGVSAPRWVFHLLGLPHRASHIGLSTPNGLIVLQRRSPTKADWPNAWDMAVAGHVPQDENGRDMTYLDGARKELEEEIGLTEADLAKGKLLPVGQPFTTYDEDALRNPPFHNHEVQQLFAGTLTAGGLARISPDFEELAGIYLCSIERAWPILEREPIACGLRFSLPRYLDWLAKHQ